jgi:hypothetical protein
MKADTSITMKGNNLVAAHITKSALDSDNLLTVLWSACEGAAGSLGGFAALGAAASTVVGLIIIAVGVVEYLIVEGPVRGETGDAWCDFQNYFNNGFSAGVDFKLGELCWWHMGFTLWGLVTVDYPLGTGGQALGIGRI